MPRPAKKVVAMSRSSSLELVQDEHERVELEQLRQDCIAAQVWSDDRALLVGFERGEEIAWSSYEDFERKRAAYLTHIRRKRRGTLGQVGERHIKKYGAGAAWSQLRLMLLVISAFAFVYVALLNGFWLPDSGTELKVWENASDRAARARAEQAVTVYPGEDFEQAPGVWVSPEVEVYRERVRKLAQLGMGMLGWWFVRRFIWRPVPKQIVIPKSIKLDMLPE